MKLDIKQINNLCVGVKLATELEVNNSSIRKFLTIQGYSYNCDGRIVRLKKTLKASVLNSIFFELRCYELSIDYYNNNWDVTEDELLSEVYKDDIKGIEELEEELRNYIEDFSVLKPEWECDNLI